MLAIQGPPDLMRIKSWLCLLSLSPLFARLLHESARGHFEGHCSVEHPSGLRLDPVTDAAGQKLTQSNTGNRAARRVFHCFGAAYVSASHRPCVKRAIP